MASENSTFDCEPLSGLSYLDDRQNIVVPSTPTPPSTPPEQNRQESNDYNYSKLPTATQVERLLQPPRTASFQSTVQLCRVNEIQDSDCVPSPLVCPKSGEPINEACKIVRFASNKYGTVTNPSPSLKKLNSGSVIKLSHENIEFKLQHSEEVNQYVTKKTKLGTAKSNQTGLHRFFQFCTNLIQNYPIKHSQFIPALQIYLSRITKSIDFQTEFLLRLIFLNGNDCTHLTDVQRARFSYFVTEFVVNYKCTRKRIYEGSIKNNMNDANPVTLKSYLLALQRIFREETNITDLQIMSLPNLKNVVDNRFKELQSKGNLPESHNTYHSKICTKFLSF